MAIQSTLREVASLMIEMLCCKNGCPRLTASACAQAVGALDTDQCRCRCHKVWQEMDLLVDLERQCGL